jgi:hypothetical protein
VARTQLRALVEEKENINTYWSRLALESRLAAHPKKLTKENISEVCALTHALASRKELAASLTSSARHTVQEPQPHLLAPRYSPRLCSEYRVPDQ